MMTRGGFRDAFKICQRQDHISHPKLHREMAAAARMVAHNKTRRHAKTDTKKKNAEDDLTELPPISEHLENKDLGVLFNG